MVPQLTIGVDREPHSRFGEERDIHHAVPDGDDLVLLYFPLRRKPPHNRSLALWTDPDRDAAGENPVLIVEFVAEGCVRFEQLKGRFRHLPRAAGDQYDFARAGVQPVDELFRAGHRPELPSRPQDLGLGEPSEPLGPRPESHLPVHPTIDSRAGYRGDLRFLPDDRREFREEFVENQGVLELRTLQGTISRHFSQAKVRQARFEALLRVADLIQLGPAGLR